MDRVLHAERLGPRERIGLGALPAGTIFRAEGGFYLRTEAGALALRVSRRLVRSTDTWTLRLAPGGGAAIRFRPATAAEVRTMR